MFSKSTINNFINTLFLERILHFWVLLVITCTFLGFTCYDMYISGFYLNSGAEGTTRLGLTTFLCNYYISGSNTSNYELMSRNIFISVISV